ncbi:MAG: hypothetical protein WC408_01025 [Candidatus Micrarchaeia archaeon]|jgi:hypothetical protein
MKKALLILFLLFPAIISATRFDFINISDSVHIDEIRINHQIVDNSLQNQINMSFTVQDDSASKTIKFDFQPRDLSNSKVQGEIIIKACQFEKNNNTRINCYTPKIEKESVQNPNITSYSITLEFENISYYKRYTVSMDYTLDNFLIQQGTHYLVWLDTSCNSKNNNCPQGTMMTETLFLQNEYSFLEKIPETQRLDRINGIWFLEFNNYGTKQIWFSNTVQTDIVQPLLWAFIGAIYGAFFSILFEPILRRLLNLIPPKIERIDIAIIVLLVITGLAIGNILDKLISNISQVNIQFSTILLPILLLGVYISTKNEKMNEEIKRKEKRKRNRFIH